MDEKLGAGSVARVLGISEGWVRHLCKAGELPYEETELGRLFSRAELEEIACQRAEQRRPGRRTSRARRDGER